MVTFDPGSTGACSVSIYGKNMRGTVPDTPAATQRTGVIALVGQANVGKSTLFHALTGRHTLVANYPGTTVEVARGAATFAPHLTIVDTPGILAFPPRSPGEEVTLRLLLAGDVRAVVLVGDAKNLRRTLLLAVQVAELGLPMVVALNMADEASRAGIDVDHELVAAYLGMPVVPTVATAGTGRARLMAAIEAAAAPQYPLAYPAEIEQAIAAAAASLPEPPVAARGLATLWIAGDGPAAEWVGRHCPPAAIAALEEQRRRLQLGYAQPLAGVLQGHRMERAERIAEHAVRELPGVRGWRGRLGRLSAHPLWGVPILAAVLYLLYLFVGLFGAGVLVDAIETDLFGEVINPRMRSWVAALAPDGIVVDAIVGEYGLWTMGMTYALALILPIVTTFFVAFGLLEDSGYLPRLSVLTNRVFRKLGLNGQAVIPMVLGLGCVTMATLSTRVLETKRERMLVILLLALAVPCSAQLGVVMGLLAGVSFAATAIWAASVLAVLLAVGWLAARLLPGDRAPLVVELPPLRRPRLGNIVLKTVARVEWYLIEVVPLFLAGTAVLFVADRLEILPRIIDAAEPLVVGWLGLPAAAGTAFLMGFLRRDFGAAGLFALAGTGVLTAAELVVAMVTITLFVPCIASVFMIARERGWRTAAALTATIFPLAFLIGGVLSRALSAAGWGA